MVKSPMDVNQVSEAITLLSGSKYTGIVHVAGEAISIFDFYREAMQSLGVDIKTFVLNKHLKIFRIQRTLH